MKIEIKNELALISALSVVLAVLVLLGRGGTLRLMLGLSLALFFPGYTLIAVIFPQKDGLRSFERLGLSFGLSIALVFFIGFLLNYTPWGINLYPTTFSLTSFIVVMSFIAWERRRRLPEATRFKISIHIDRSRWIKLSRLDRFLWVVLIGCIIFVVSSLSYMVLTPKIGERYSEFYILGLAGEASDYPEKVSVVTPTTLILGMVNHEHKKVKYRVEIRMRDELIGTVGPIFMNHEEKWEQEVSFTPVTPAKSSKVEFLLYKDNADEPYRSLHLWVDVERRKA